jgi:hypothetical protein
MILQVLDDITVLNLRVNELGRCYFCNAKYSSVYIYNLRALSDDAKRMG